MREKMLAGVLRYQRMFIHFIFSGKPSVLVNAEKVWPVPIAQRGY